MLHPVGTLQVSQRLVPLDLTLDKFGNQQPTDANRFALTVTAGGLTKTRDLQEPFAPAQFRNIDDAGKLSQPAYVPQDSGIELAVAGSTYASATAITRIVRYDLTIIDTKLPRAFSKFFTLAGALFSHFLRGASVARCALSAFRKAQTHPYRRRRHGRAGDLRGRAASRTTRCSAPTRPHSPARRRPTTTSRERSPAIPSLCRHAARPAAIRDGRMSTLATYSFLPWLRQGIANTIAVGRQRPQRQDARHASTSRCSSPAIRWRRHDRAHRAVWRRTSRSTGPGDIVGIDARAIVRTEPRPWITNFESNYLAASSSTTRISPGATRRRRRTASGLQAASLDHADRPAGDRVQRGQGRRSTAAAVHHDHRSRPLLPPRGRAVGLGACALQSESVADSTTELVSPDMGAVLPRVQAIIGAESRSRLFAADVPAPARRQ